MRPTVPEAVNAVLFVNLRGAVGSLGADEDLIETLTSFEKAVLNP